MRCLVPTLLALVLAAVAPWPGAGTNATAAARRQAAPALLSQQELADLIDQSLAAAWQEQKLQPTAPADDAVWLRRVSLDLCGSIPDRDEVARFLEESAPDKRARKIDEYLADRRFAENLSYLWTNLLLASAGKDAERTKSWVQPWIETQIQAGMPYRELVHHMIADAGSTIDPGSLSFILSYRDAIETIAGVSARTFLGLQIQCAQCHDHPFDKWKQTDFNRFTGFFLDMRADHVPTARKGVPLFRVLDMTPEWDLRARLHRIIASHDKGDGEGGDMMSGGGGAMSEAPDDTMVTDAMSATPPESAPSRPATEANSAALVELIKLCRQAENGKAEGLEQLDADPKKFEEFSARLAPDARDLLKRWHDRRAAFGTAGYLDGTPYESKEGVTRRAALADWMTSAENPWFAKAAVNRLWKLLFAKGLTEPVDDLSAKDDRVATELLDRLAEEFNKHGTDLRFLAGALARTHAYALSNSVVTDEAERDGAERWFAAHAPRSFTPEQMTNSLLAATAVEDANGRRGASPSEAARARLLDEMTGYFGTKGGGNEGFAANIPQALFLMNGGYADRGEGMRHSAMFTAFSDDKRSAAERLRPLFLATLSRPPTAAEAEKLTPLALHAKSGPAAGFDDLFWSLVNSTEFHTNH